MRNLKNVLLQIQVRNIEVRNKEVLHKHLPLMILALTDLENVAEHQIAESYLDF